MKGNGEFRRQQFACRFSSTSKRFLLHSRAKSRGGMGAPKAPYAL